MFKVGIIGGSGIDEKNFSPSFKIEKIQTEYGEIKVRLGTAGGKEIIYLNRHGESCGPPREVNARGNIQALKRLGAEGIIATAAVGSMNLKMKPGDFVLLSDFIDFTEGRTEYLDPLKFTDVSSPYDGDLRKLVLKAAKKLKIKVHPTAVYVCTKGPRFESKAEIRAYKRLGAEVVGMTQVPEVVLANELGIPYAVIAVVTNYAAGISRKKISSDEVIGMMKKKADSLSRLILQTIFLPSEK